MDRSPAPDEQATSITELLADLRAGRREAFDQILPLVYRELRVAARRELAVRPSDSMSTTALVHELYLKFSRASVTDWQSRAHFLGVASVAMRHILVDRARRRRTGPGNWSPDPIWILPGSFAAHPRLGNCYTFSRCPPGGWR